MFIPWKPKSICSNPGCNELTHDRYCSRHKRGVSKGRNNINSKIYNNRWRKAIKTYLKDNPPRAHCEKEDRLTPTTEVDHIIPKCRDMKLFCDKSNWQSLCKKCHSKKTALEDSRFGDHVDIDVAITTEHMALAAADLGLGTCWVCAFDAKRCHANLELPDSLEVIALLPVGYPES
ncbi:MAG TPA: hypothetical protein DDZ89_10345 [Clostridiales bacterium]|nr:hypothetical protein [Clostridiales bacterium]